MNSQQLSIVVITRNEAARIGSLLERLLPQCGPGVEILVVDGASKDLTCEIVSCYQARGVRLLRLDSCGFAIQRNAGARAARGRHLLFLSADTWPTERLIARFLHWLETDADLVQGSAVDVVRPNESRMLRALCDFRRFIYRPTIARGDLFARQLSAINLAVRADLVRAQPFDERLPALEDKAWGLESKPLRFVRAPTALVHHEFRENIRAFWQRIHRESIALGMLTARHRGKQSVMRADFFGWITLAAALWATTGAAAFAGSFILRLPTPSAAIVGATLGMLAPAFAAHWRFPLQQPRSVWKWLTFPVLTLVHATAVASGIPLGLWRGLARSR